jgi:hypothetical protein
MLKQAVYIKITVLIRLKFQLGIDRHALKDVWYLKREAVELSTRKFNVPFVNKDAAVHKRNSDPTC